MKFAAFGIAVALVFFSAAARADEDIDGTLAPAPMEEAVPNPLWNVVADPNANLDQLGEQADEGLQIRQGNVLSEVNEPEED